MTAFVGPIGAEKFQRSAFVGVVGVFWRMYDSRPSSLRNVVGHLSMYLQGVPHQSSRSLELPKQATRIFIVQTLPATRVQISAVRAFMWRLSCWLYSLNSCLCNAKFGSPSP